MKEIEPPIASEQFTGVFIPAEIWLHPELNCVEKCLLAEIGALGGHKGKCTAGNSHLGRHVGVGAHRVSVMIAHLEELKLIEIVSFDGRTRTLRCFYDTKADFAKKQRQSIDKSNSRPVEKAKEERTNRNNEIETGEAFEVFWKEYPKKTGKLTALKAFEAVKNLDVEFPKMLKALEVQKPAWGKDNNKFIPKPEAWLEAGRWLDDVTAYEETENPNDVPF